MEEPRSIVLAAYEAFNARRFDECAALMDEDVVLVGADESVRGRAAATDCAAGLVRAVPTLRLRVEEILGEGETTVVVRVRAVVAGVDELPVDDGAATVLCHVHRLVSGRIVEVRHYVDPERSSTAALDPHRLVAEQAALRRVAELVAHGVATQEVFDQVAREASELLDHASTGLVRFEESVSEALVLAQCPAVVVGTRYPVTGETATARVWRTGKPVRIDDYDGVAGADRLPDVMKASVSAPIVVAGELWGLLVARSADRPLPAGTEERLTGFCELVAVAIANAESLIALESLVEEQAALRRVAELVAHGASTQQMFDQVTAEASRLLDDAHTELVRYDRSGTEVVNLAQSRPPAVDTATDGRFTVGERLPVTGDIGRAQVWRTGKPVRIDSYRDLAGAELISDVIGASVLAPITVADELWGVLIATSPGPPLPPGTEQRLSNFGTLIAAAIANTESRAALETLLEEQAALRRVAELVAHGAATQDVFDRVTQEASRLLGSVPMWLVRFEAAGAEAVVVAQIPRAPVQKRYAVIGDVGSARLWRTKKPVRIDDYSTVDGAEMIEDAGGASVLAPILVDGRIWGELVARSQDAPLPAGVEEPLARFGDLVAAAIANAESRSALKASRARIVASADAARRRLARDVHDGAQQRQVHTIITLKQAQAALYDDTSRAESLIQESLQQAEAANEQLRELAHGIMPAALARGGLRAGVESLRGHVSLAVDAQVTAQRLPAALEATAYFVVAEALTNVTKHAAATQARVSATIIGDDLQLEVCDNGCGGVNPAAGSGLTSLSDRVDAAGGTMTLVSPHGAGTHLSVALPVAFE